MTKIFFNFASATAERAQIKSIHAPNLFSEGFSILLSRLSDIMYRHIFTSNLKVSSCAAAETQRTMVQLTISVRAAAKQFAKCF